MSLITEKQIRETVDKYFLTYDKNKSGFIERSEATNMFKQIAGDLANGKQLTKENIDAAFKFVDSSRDGKISKDEMVSAAKDFLFL